MKILQEGLLISAISLSALALTACGGSDSTDAFDEMGEETTEEETTEEETTEEESTEEESTEEESTFASSSESIDINNFVEGALLEAPIVDCTLNDGTETSCYEVITVGEPAGQTPGPFCPENINDFESDEDSGMWFHESGVDGIVELTGSFIQDLAVTYNDSNWLLYDETTGDVKITDTLYSCEQAAQPVVPEEYNNYCIECEMDYLEGGVASATYYIPVTPQAADTTGNVSQVGVALNGTELSAAAPVDAILGAYTIAVFDDCGGHINTHQGYHYHAATDCAAVGDQEDGHSALMGYALDGYGIYAMRDADGNEAEGLDECRGQTDDVRGYHYHAASPGENLFIGCFHGKTVGATDTGPGDGEGPGDGAGPGGQ